MVSIALSLTKFLALCICFVCSRALDLLLVIVFGRLSLLFRHTESRPEWCSIVFNKGLVR